MQHRDYPPDTNPARSAAAKNEVQHTHGGSAARSRPTSTFWSSCCDRAWRATPNMSTCVKTTAAAAPASRTTPTRPTDGVVVMRRIVTLMEHWPHPLPPEALTSEAAEEVLALALVPHPLPPEALTSEAAEGASPPVTAVRWPGVEASPTRAPPPRHRLWVRRPTVRPRCTSTVRRCMPTVRRLRCLRRARPPTRRCPRVQCSERRRVPQLSRRPSGHG